MIIFLDRDGVINIDNGYTNVFDPKIIYEDIEYLTKFEFSQIFVVTNQSGIGRGFYTESDFHKFMNDLSCYLKIEYGLILTDYFFCPHIPNPDGGPACHCRKPNTGMFETAISKYKIDITNSMMIGDKISDVTAGMKAGVANNYLLDRYGTYLDVQNEFPSFSAHVIKTLRQIKI